MASQRTTRRADAPDPHGGSSTHGDTEPFDPLSAEDEPATVAMPDTPAPPRAPLVLDRYRLSKTLGAGAFGTVWLAYDERLARPVAVKAIPAIDGTRARAEREALAAARLNHPSIVMLFEAGEEGGVTYLVSELVDGYTLGQLFADGALSDRDVVRVGIALCEALAHAHAHGVVHRDVKPSNVLVPARRTPGAGIVKLADFGVAQVAGGDLLTRTGDIVGTLAYMAPEQAEGRAVGSACDLYSLALVLYEGLTGEQPVLASTPAATARRLGQPIEALDRRRRGLPAGLGAAIDRALAIDQTVRGSLGDLREALERALPLVDAEAGPVGAPLFDRLRFDSVPLGYPARLAAGVAAAALTGLALTRLGHAGGLAAPLAAGAGVGVALLPRIAWYLCGLALCGWQLGPAEHAGVALVLLCAVVLPPLLLPRWGAAWSAPAGAPLLGLIGLAGAWPALASLASNPWRRGALGALGFWWLCMAELLIGHGLYLARPLGVTGRSTWEGSLTGVVEHGLRPLVESGRPLGAAVWAIAAVAAPLLVRGPLLVAVIGAVVWAAGLGAGIGLLPGAPSGATVALGAGLGGALALGRAVIGRDRREVDAPDVAAAFP